MLLDKSHGEVVQATVVAVGSGCQGPDGDTEPEEVLPECGGTKGVSSQPQEASLGSRRTGRITLKWCL